MQVSLYELDVGISIPLPFAQLRHVNIVTNPSFLETHAFPTTPLVQRTGAEGWRNTR